MINKVIKCSIKLQEDIDKLKDTNTDTEENNPQLL